MYQRQPKIHYFCKQSMFVADFVLCWLRNKKPYIIIFLGNGKRNKKISLITRQH